MAKFNVNIKKVLLVALIVAFVTILASVSVSYALMSDKASGSGIIQFKQHKLDIKVVNDESFSFTPEELMQGNTIVRKLNISNPKNSTSCVLRIWMEFLVDGKENTSCLDFNVKSDNFMKSDGNKFYYADVLASNGKIENLELDFTVQTKIGNNYQGKGYEMKVYIESIQSTTSAVDEWKDDYSPEWIEKVSKKLS